MARSARSFAWTVLVPVLAAVGVAAWLAAAPGEFDLIRKVSSSTGMFLAAAGALLAAGQFSRGDHLRAGWILTAIGYAALFLSALIRQPDPPEWIRIARVALTLVSNVTGVVGTWMFASAYRRAGIDLPLSAGQRRNVYGVAGALIFLLGAIPVYNNARALFAPDANYMGYVAVISSTGDSVMFLLILPVLFTTLALRGGLLVWPWALLTASFLSWLVYGAQDTVDFALELGRWDVDPDLRRMIFEPWRMAACGFAFVAGVAQRQVGEGGAEE